MNKRGCCDAHLRKVRQDLPVGTDEFDMLVERVKGGCGMGEASAIVARKYGRPRLPQSYMRYMAWLVAPLPAKKDWEARRTSSSPGVCHLEVERLTKAEEHEFERLARVYQPTAEWFEAGGAPDLTNWHVPGPKPMGALL